MDQIIDDNKLLRLCTSGDVQSIVLVAVTLLGLGEEKLLEFLSKYGQPRGYKYSETTPISTKVIRTGLHPRHINDESVYIKYNSKAAGQMAYIYCGHYLSVFRGHHNSIIRIIDFTQDNNK